VSPQELYPSSVKTNTEELDSDCMGHERIKHEYNATHDRYHPYLSNRHSPRHSYTENRTHPDHHPSSVYERSSSFNQEIHYDYDYHSTMQRSLSASPRHSAFSVKPSSSPSILTNRRMSPVSDKVMGRRATCSPDQHHNHLQVRRASTSVPTNGYYKSLSPELSMHQRY